MAISDFIRLRKLGLPFQTFLHIVHRLFQAAVHDPSIMLRHTCGGMAEHDGHVLQGYIVGERDGGPESVPGHMRGQIFLYAAEIGDFLEVAVHFLVAHDRQAASFLYADRMFPVFLQYGQWNGQQRDVADGRRFSAVFQLDPSLPYPPVTEIVLYQVFTTQSGDIGERQTGEAREDKYVPDQLEPWDGEFLFHDGLQLVVGQEYRIGLVLFHLVTVKGILTHPFLCQCHVGEFLETFHVADYRVTAQSPLRFQVNVKRADELRCQLMEGDILLAVIRGDKPLQFLHHVLVPVDRNGRVVYACQCFHFLDAILHGTEQCTHFGVFPENTFQDQFRGNQGLFQYQFLVFLEGTCV